MSTLTENLNKRRAEEIATASYLMANERQSSLIVARWEGECWVLPWSQFQSARLEDKKVELSFGAVLVIIAGENLLGLKEAIAAYRISLLREVPPEYRQKAAVGEPFVAGIEVRPAEG